jgi:hypothetical protein
MGVLRTTRRVYGTPWSKLSGVELSLEVLLKVGKIIAEEIANEARKDYMRKGRTPRGEPMGLPNTKRFFDSFSVEISGERTILIKTSWPWIERHMEGRDAFKMWWLTQSRGVYKVPMIQDDGRVLIVSTPATLADAWIHPGALKFNFVSRGVQKGRIKAATVIAEEFLKMLLAGDPLK